MKFRSLFWFLVLAFGLAGSSLPAGAEGVNAPQGIQLYKANPWCWEYEGEPQVLIGASDDDNLF